MRKSHRYKKLQIWWDEENDPTHSETISLGQGDPMNESRTQFMIRDTFDHVYRGITQVETRRVRVRLSVEGELDDCSRVRHIEIGLPVSGPFDCSGAKVPDSSWFVNSNSSPGGTGTFRSPFNTIAAASGAASPGDTIVVLAGNYAGGVVLEDGQRLHRIGCGGVLFR